jgi:hypothetical protein
MSHEQTHNNENQLRFTFVGMLFALAIAETAIQFAKLVDIGAPLYHPASFHLGLAAFLIATSWIGWARSKAPGNIRAVKEVFSLEFVVLLIDILLVFFYFIIVKGAEIPASKTEISGSAENETRWMMFVFGGYFAWDLWTKVVIRPESGPGLWKRLWSPYSRRKLGITAFCLGLAILIRLTRNCLVARSHGVIFVDIILILLVLLFRLLKQFLWRETSPPSVS